MKTDIFFAADWLRVDENRTYGKSLIPHPYDNKINELLREWLELSESNRKVAVEGICCAGRWLNLQSYSERKAALAVREHKEEWIYFGVLALGLIPFDCCDWRDNILLLSLHCDAAKKLSICPEPIFEKVATLLPEKETTDILRDFMLRSEHDRSISLMGYKEGSDDNGFRYIRTW